MAAGAATNLSHGLVTLSSAFRRKHANGTELARRVSAIPQILICVLARLLTVDRPFSFQRQDANRLRQLPLRSKTSAHPGPY